MKNNLLVIYHGDAFGAHFRRRNKFHWVDYLRHFGKKVCEDHESSSDYPKDSNRVCQSLIKKKCFNLNKFGHLEIIDEVAIFQTGADFGAETQKREPRHQKTMDTHYCNHYKTNDLRLFISTITLLFNWHQKCSITYDDF